MKVEELLARLQRIYASVDAMEEFDMTKLPGTVRQDEGFISVSQDFTGGLSAAEIENTAHAGIHNIANLDNHLIGWARRNGVDDTKIKEAIEASDSIKKIKDLSNNDKHGYPPRDGGLSRVSPQLLNIRRVMQISTGGEAGSSIAMTLGPDGVPSVVSRGSASARAVITGDVVDKDGNRLGDLVVIETAAITDLEKVMADVGIVVSDIDNGAQPIG